MPEASSRDEFARALQAELAARLPLLLLAFAALAGTVDPADASRPVRRTITGCVVDGTLVSDDGYRIRVTDSRTRRRVDLARFEGRRIRYTGSLLPGDVYFVKGRPAVLGPCRSPADVRTTRRS